MATSDLFRRSVEIGTSFVDMTRERAEAVVKEWVDAGDLGRAKAKTAVDDLLDRSHRITDELRSMIRREISEQLSALGVATAGDLARLEAKIDAAGGPEQAAATGPRRRATKTATTKAATTKTATTKTAATKTAATKSPRRRATGSPDPGPGS